MPLTRVTGNVIADGTIQDADIANATITGSKIVTGTITSSNIADGTITNADISSSTIIDRAKLQLSPPAGVKTVYIAPRTDGIAGTGSESDPYDAGGSTEEIAADKYDAIFSNRTKCPKKCTIKLLPGNYFTRGCNFWPEGFFPDDDYNIKYPGGASLIGSGTESTVIKFIGPTSGGKNIIINSITRSGTVATGTCPNPAGGYGVYQGLSILISGANESQWNDVFYVTSVVTTPSLITFTFNVPSSFPSQATGTLRGGGATVNCVVAIGGTGDVTGIQVVSDLTVDCNWQNTKKPHKSISAVRIGWSADCGGWGGVNPANTGNSLVARVKAINIGGDLTNNIECFSIISNGQNISVIDQCTVLGLRAGWDGAVTYASCLVAGYVQQYEDYFLGTTPPTFFGYVIKNTEGVSAVTNCLVIGGGDGATRSGFATGFNTITQNNRFVNTTYGCWHDTGYSKRTTVDSNTFENVMIPIACNIFNSELADANYGYKDCGNVYVPFSQDTYRLSNRADNYVEKITFTNNFIRSGVTPPDFQRAFRFTHTDSYYVEKNVYFDTRRTATPYTSTYIGESFYCRNANISNNVVSDTLIGSFEIKDHLGSITAINNKNQEGITRYDCGEQFLNSLYVTGSHQDYFYGVGKLEKISASEGMLTTIYEQVTGAFPVGATFKITNATNPTWNGEYVIKTVSRDNPPTFSPIKITFDVTGSKPTIQSPSAGVTIADLQVFSAEFRNGMELQNAVNRAGVAYGNDRNITINLSPAVYKITGSLANGRKINYQGLSPDRNATIIKFPNTFNAISISNDVSLTNITMLMEKSPSTGSTTGTYFVYSNFNGKYNIKNVLFDATNDITATSGYFIGDLTDCKWNKRFVQENSTSGFQGQGFIFGKVTNCDFLKFPNTIGPVWLTSGFQNYSATIINCSGQNNTINFACKVRMEDCVLTTPEFFNPGGQCSVIYLRYESIIKNSNIIDSKVQVFSTGQNSTLMNLFFYLTDVPAFGSSGQVLVVSDTNGQARSLFSLNSSTNGPLFNIKSADITFTTLNAL